MAKFVLLYSGGSMPETEAETKNVIDAWTAWYNSLGAAVVDPGNPFTPVAKSVSSNGAVHDGALGMMASGYTIVQADSLNKAVQFAQSCPVLKGGGSISVYETFNVM